MPMWRLHNPSCKRGTKKRASHIHHMLYTCYYLTIKSFYYKTGGCCLYIRCRCLLLVEKKPCDFYNISAWWPWNLKISGRGGTPYIGRTADVRTIWMGLFSMQICRKWVYFTICRPGFKIIHPNRPNGSQNGQKYSKVSTFSWRSQ